MRWQITAIAASLILGIPQAAAKDAVKSLDSAAARDEAQAQLARQRAQEALTQRQDAANAAAYAAALREKQQMEAEGANLAMQRALAGVGPVGGDALSASGRAALAVHANAARQRAASAADAIGKSERQFQSREQQIAALITSLDEAASAFEARANAQRAAAARERERSALEARRKKLALTKARSASAKAPATQGQRPALASVASAKRPALKSAATLRLVEGGGSIVRGFGEQRAGGPPAAGVTLVPSRFGDAILAPLDGKVLHAGPLRHLGIVLIMDAGDGYVLVFGGLADVGFPAGAHLSKGDRIGRLPQSAESALYFEVRHNGISIDPDSWSKLRS